MVGVQVVEHHTGQAAFEAAQCLCLGIASIDAFAVVGLAESVKPDLSDGNAV